MPSIKRCPIKHSLLVTLFNNSQFLRLVFKYREHNYDITTNLACATVPTYGNIHVRRQQQETSQVFTARVPVNLNSIQVGRHTGGKGWKSWCACVYYPQLYRNTRSSVGFEVSNNMAYKLPSSLSFCCCYCCCCLFFSSKVNCSTMKKQLKTRLIPSFFLKMCSLRVTQ